MKKDFSTDGYDGYCGTRYAAKLLNLSVGTIQNLVESNILTAWKTQGGHRRISLNSINEYLVANGLEPAAWYPNDHKFRALVVEDDEKTRLMYQAYFARWALPIEVVMYGSALEAMLDMPAMQPQVLLTDLNMPNIDGFKFLKTVREYKLFASLPIIVITGLSMEQIKLKGGLPGGVQLLQKPIDMEWLRGFLEAMITTRKIKGMS